MLPADLIWAKAVMTHHASFAWQLVEHQKLSNNNNQCCTTPENTAAPELSLHCRLQLERVSCAISKSFLRAYLNMGTVRYRKAVTPDTTYNHQQNTSGSICTHSLNAALLENCQNTQLQVLSPAWRPCRSEERTETLRRLSTSACTVWTPKLAEWSQNWDSESHKGRTRPY